MNKLLPLVLAEGEGWKVEFKEKPAHLDREMVAFANGGGGVIYLGVTDQGQIVGLPITNRLKSEITDIARNCDPPIAIELFIYQEEKVLAILIDQGSDRPYRCRDGFFIRNGPSAQKLNRDELLTLISESGAIRFDESPNHRFRFPEELSEESLTAYLRLSGITTHASFRDILITLNVAEEREDRLELTNSGVLFFAKNPQRFLPESYITGVKYRTQDRFSIIDKKDFFGSPITQIEEALAFAIRHMNVEFYIGGEIKPGSLLGRNHSFYEYPIVALREAIVNAVTHRDYLYDSSHIYLHMFPDRLEIENPGGLFRGMTLDYLGKRSVRRNRLIADLLHRAGYIERVGSGFDRMRHALEENNNPPFEVAATNFFSIRFFPRLAKNSSLRWSERQGRLLKLIQERGTVTKRDVAHFLHMSEDTAIRELKGLIVLGVIEKIHSGKSTAYRCL